MDRSGQTEKDTGSCGLFGMEGDCVCVGRGDGGNEARVVDKTRLQRRLSVYSGNGGIILFFFLREINSVINMSFL